MSQTFLSSTLFLISSGIWALLAILFHDFRLLNLFLFIVFLMMGLSKRHRLIYEKDDEED
ncbi:hypothetical protein SAMN05192559_10622 [Halobacillus karajensis]|uniref:Uncharacterized protein n=1 Tax=Halobacillus karajensis TaxID=195088 RepID=A0A024P7K6_9BACI|nr:hypothetical protein [Halobacillus karajensis]CDQ21198.1 hypothetical protein BN982_03563 [Halobacillus karajensis]CDQ24738.1 hypothetical protein BN983_03035 [Halobacillus karajensis]CDQ28902.1 hypothetical protein BN981_03219 [Halobacillus karajensis]SEH94922.1 hypothetical protein SAMN05192559_10622 [Halobacillus karajensis]